MVPTSATGVRRMPFATGASAETVGGIQLDSINVVERAHHLTLWNRFGPYDRRTLERLAYRRQVLFEYWAHAACLVPVAHFAAWRRAMIDYHKRNRGWARFLQKNRAILGAVEAAIRERGPLGNKDFDNPNSPSPVGHSRAPDHPGRGPLMQGLG